VIRAVVVLALAGGCANDGGPHLVAVSPATAAPGDIVEITGTGFCGAVADCAHVAASVILGTSSPYVDAVPVSWTATIADVQIPTAAPVGKSELVMTVDDQSSNALTIELVAP
jgi:hypothetical protein